MTTVSELIADLQAQPYDARVLATWEGITREVTVYRAKDGTVLIDADEGNYRSMFEEGRNTRPDNEGIK